MAKKFGKFLLLTAAVTTAAAAAYYYLQKKDSCDTTSNEEDEDYDNFSDELEEDADAASRSYVHLNRECAEHTEETPVENDTPADDTAATANDTPVSETIEKVEEFFDEE